MQLSRVEWFYLLLILFALTAVSSYSDPCLSNNCDVNAVCTNTSNTYNCTCNDGYSGNGTTCEDINECTTNAHNCDMNAACTNTNGSFSCSCNSGYSGNGTYCTDIDECLNASSCDKNAACTNTVGSFMCDCDVGYSGDGKTCFDLLCDARIENCSVLEIPYVGADMSVMCAFNKTKAPQTEMIVTDQSSFDAKYVHCNIPTSHQVKLDNYLSNLPGVAKRTIWSALTTDNITFKHTVWSHTIYDSRCMDCDVTNCTLKAGTCLIRGYCFIEKDVDPNDPTCKVCLPSRSTSEFVYPRDDIHECKDRVKVDCEVTQVTVTWDKEMYGASSFEAYLNTPLCNKVQSNSSHYWLTGRYTECGSHHTTFNDVITESSVATVVVTRQFGGVVERTAEYQYNVKCTFNQTQLLSVQGAVNSSTNHYEAGNFNITSEAEVNFTMNIYSSSSFLVPKDRPVTVTTNQPLFVGIRNLENDGRYKFVTTRCFATPSNDPNNPTYYAFFDQKCGLDYTFKEYNKTDINSFDFQVNSFIFINLHRQIYLHCDIYICHANTTTADCTQSCKMSSRRRRAISNTDQPIAKQTLSSELITFKPNIKKCKDILCPTNSHCLEVYPAECRCDSGYFFSAQTSQCFQEKDRILVVKNLNLDMTFVPTYSDSTTFDFEVFANKVERELLEQINDPNIISIRVLSARSGSIIVELEMVYAQNTTSRTAADTFLTGFSKFESAQKEQQTENSVVSKIKTFIIPTVTERGSEIVIEDSIDIDALIIGLVIALCTILFFIAMVIYLCVKRRHNTKRNKFDRKEITGFDNQGLEEFVVCRKRAKRDSIQY